MTIEEAKKILEAYIACESKKAHFKCDDDNCDDNCPLRYEMGTVGEYNEAINMAIKALEQEPCDDATLKDIFCMGCEYKEQEPKTVLYSGDGYADGYMVYDMAECPHCGYEYEDGDKDWGLSFCPNCGQALDWESEDKE